MEKTKNAEKLDTMKDQNNIKPPAGLKGAALQLWRRYADELHTRKMLHEADLAALERLCRLEVQSALLLAQIETEGVIIKDLSLIHI